MPVFARPRNKVRPAFLPTHLPTKVLLLPAHQGKRALLLSGAKMLRKYSDDQERDYHGRFSGPGGDGGEMPSGLPTNPVDADDAYAAGMEALVVPVLAAVDSVGGAGVLGVRVTSDYITNGLMDSEPTVPVEVRGALKQNICYDLAAHAALSSIDANGVANDLLRNWAETSNDNDMRSLSLQQMVADQFGVPLSEWQAGKLETMGVAREVGYAGYVAMPNAQGVIDIASPAFAKTFPEWQAERRGIGAEEADKAGRDMLQRMYDRTQEQFAAAGVTEVVVYRGVSSDAIPNDIWSTVQLPSSAAVSVRLAGANAAESWSLSPHVAQEFVDHAGGNGAVIQTIVPVTAILSTFTSGWGCAEEAELVVLNHGTMDARVAHDAGGLLGVLDPNDEFREDEPSTYQGAW